MVNRVNKFLKSVGANVVLLTLIPPLLVYPLAGDLKLSSTPRLPSSLLLSVFNGVTFSLARVEKCPLLTLLLTKLCLWVFSLKLFSVYSCSTLLVCKLSSELVQLNFGCSQSQVCLSLWCFSCGKNSENSSLEDLNGSIESAYGDLFFKK